MGQLQRSRQVAPHRDESLSRIQGSVSNGVAQAKKKRQNPNITERFRHALAGLERFFRGIEESGNRLSVLAERLREIEAEIPRIDLWRHKAEWNEKVAAWPELPA